MPNPNTNSRPFSLFQNFPRAALALPLVLLAACGGGDGDSDGNPGAITVRPQQTLPRKVLLMAGTFCLLFTAAFLGSRPAYAGHNMRFCNQSPHKIWASWASTIRSPVLSRGGWTLSPGECKTISTTRGPGSLWAGAKIYGEDRWWSGNATFCVNNRSAYFIEKDGSSFRDRERNSGWNTCTRLGNNYDFRYFSKSPHTFKSESKYRNPWHTSYYKYARVCTAKFQANFNVSWSCGSWQRTN